MKWREGDWVSVVCKDQKVTGYIEYLGETVALVKSTTSHNFGRTLAVYRKDLMEVSNIIHVDDLPYLIDLSIAMEDKEWFMELSYELKKWKKAEDVL
ncbi:group-specific protein-like protein [Bacillus phage Shbh1]|uniref:Group-specific protein-like protein n=1 Tax=Bacillus phage Shbh1 TaxID=1796992 RepID=A0A142F1E4_9CAUD|nr:group-specific protein-like protein [Bacillus phage Shbh1]AMQ66601.1 group-specific protein-like protein [Bacillus phage Shbh1]